MYEPTELDDHIVSELRDGSPHRAIAMLLQHHGPRVCGALTRKFGVANEEEIHHAIHDAAMTLWRDVTRFDPDRGSLGNWFLTCAGNNTKNLLRAKAARPVLGFVDDLPCRARETRSEATERKLVALRRGLGRLSERQQHIILSGLAGAHDCDDELAAQLNTTVGTIRTTRNKALNRLGRLIERELRSGAAAVERTPVLEAGVGSE